VVVAVVAVVVVGGGDDDEEEEEEGKSRHPFGHPDDIPNCIKHWPCAVKTHFLGQHLRPGRSYIYIYIYIYNIYNIYIYYITNFLARIHFEVGSKPNKRNNAAP